MATMVLQTAGSTLGGAVGGPIGASLGRIIGSSLGGAIDNKLFGGAQNTSSSGFRMEDLSVQSSAYGQMIPIIYGTTRIAGNVIWSQNIKEVATTTTTSAGGKGGGAPKASHSSTSFSYFVTLAIAICEGPIDEVTRVWADAKDVTPEEGNYRLYKGDEEQTPDSLIESIEGVGKVPAYRGISYVVVEDFPLADYGNRIPNFTFEVRKSASNKNLLSSSNESEGSPNNEPLVEDLIKNMVIIPGSGEFVYDDTVQSKVNGFLIGGDTWVPQGNKSRINQNNRDRKCDALLSLDQLENTCPNLEYVSIVVTWFGNDLDAGNCIIEPRVEYKEGAITEPDSWQVAGLTRNTANQITLVNDAPRYGGTPSDASLLRYIKEIKSRGYKVVLLPMFFMDIDEKPWRGRVTGTHTDVSSFFTKTKGYNEFINHYANLTKDDIDSFIIGSELIGLTSVQNTQDNSFPAVDALINLASNVRSIVGSDVKISYAADWSEYHHDANGWYNLDPLWASDDIDFVGIDAYFPLTDEPEPSGGFTDETLQNGWTSGEGYDWYYSDENRTIKEPLDEKYAWKNIDWWWKNNHVNPDMSTTSWNPMMKKIWFTEFGFPSVDGASNQPNVFVDPESSESNYPRFSQKNVNFRAQRNAIKATLNKWKDSDMIERSFLWTWDARPFPYYPDLSEIWSDGNLWRVGHWVSGKLGLSSLAAIVSDLSQRTGLKENQIDVTRLSDLVDGFVINGQASVRSLIDNLRKAFFFDAVESDGVIKYVARGGSNLLTIEEDALVPENDANFRNSLTISRMQELELPQKIDVVYINKNADYQTGNQHSQRLTSNSLGTTTISLPIVMENQLAKNIADIALYNSWLERTNYSFQLPIKYAKIEPTDIITLNIGNNASHIIRVTDIKFGKPGLLKIEGVAEDVTSYNFNNTAGDITNGTNSGILSEPGQTEIHYLDLPALPSDEVDTSYLRYAASGDEQGWRGAAIFRSDDVGANYNQVLNIPNGATIGATIDILSGSSEADSSEIISNIFDESSSVTVNLIGNNELASASELAVLNGANLAMIGNELLQFKNAELLEEGRYRLSGFLRGRLGTEHVINGHTAGEKFILIDTNITKESMSNEFIGLNRLYKAVSFGNDLSQAEVDDFTYQGNALKPFSPVHISGKRDSSLNLAISWVRRARINGSWKNNVDVPLDEDSERYEIDIINDSGNVMRTIESSDTSATYTSAQQIEDFGSEQENVNVRIYQISSIIGRGTAGQGEV